MKLITIIGARPQFIKAAMLSRAIEKYNQNSQLPLIEEKILHTGQHYDFQMSGLFFQELGIPAPAWNLGCTGSPEEMSRHIQPILQAEQPDYVIVYGDTNSTAGGALAAHEARIPLVHIEAGLRSFNLQMAEERNRILTDKLSSRLFCPTATAVENLRKEGIVAGVQNVGDIMYDAALEFGQGDRQLLQTLQIEKPYILMTLHRAENTDHRKRMLSILQAIRDLGRHIVWPMHPRTKKVIEQDEELRSLIGQCAHLRLIEGQGYRAMAILEREAQLILTDSGGVQKEAFFHHVPCITMRDETEWVETIEAGWNVLTGADYSRILEAVSQPPVPLHEINEYGDGHTAEKILQCLLES